MQSDQEMNKYAASAVVGVLLLFVIYALLPYFNALFAAIILLPLFGPVAEWMIRRWKLSRSAAAVCTIVIIVLIFILPAATMSPLIISQFIDLTNNEQMTSALVAGLERITGSPENAAAAIDNSVKEAQNFIKKQIPSFVSELSDILISLTITFFTFFYLVINPNLFEKNFKRFIPFNEQNTERLVQEFHKVTSSTVIGLGLIGLIQGLLVSLGFLIFGLQGAVLWGFVTLIVSVVPLAGSAIIWVGAGAINLLLGNYGAGIGILLWGALLVANVDNIVRPIIARRLANVHPLIMIVGVFMGLPIFGLIGFITGPLLLSYLFLTIKMYSQEYM